MKGFEETPWTARGRFVSDTTEAMGGKLCVMSKTNTVIAVTWSDDVRRAIVRAVNAHDGILAALKALVEQAESVLETLSAPDREVPDWVEAVKRARAAIAKAEEA